MVSLWKWNPASCRKPATIVSLNGSPWPTPGGSRRNKLAIYGNKNSRMGNILCRHMPSFVKKYNYWILNIELISSTDLVDYFILFLTHQSSIVQRQYSAYD